MVEHHSTLPILYSFRRCPYAMRARMAIAAAGLRVELREVVLKDKPASLRAYSAKATVPVLVLPDGHVVDESLDIMSWAARYARYGPYIDYLDGYDEDKSRELITLNDGEFKLLLDRYKYADRHPQQSMRDYRDLALVFIKQLDKQLDANTFLVCHEPRFVDIAIFPFVRQFAMVDYPWFLSCCDFPHVQWWLSFWLAHPLFSLAMNKYAKWQEHSEGVIFSGAV